NHHDAEPSILALGDSHSLDGGLLLETGPGPDSRNGRQGGQRDERGASEPQSARSARGRVDRWGKRPSLSGTTARAAFPPGGALSAPPGSPTPIRRRIGPLFSRSGRASPRSLPSPDAQFETNFSRRG